MITKASESPFNELNPIKTGTMLDKLTGIGGIPRRRILEIYGDSGVGKSTLLLHAVAAAQEQGLSVLWCDTEVSYIQGYAESLKVDNRKLDLLVCETAEEMLDEIEKAVNNKTYDLIILDSIGGLLPRQEAEKGAGEKTIGGQAGLVARFCRKVVPLLALRNVALVVINHSFTDIMSGAIKTSGGAKLEYHKSISIRLKKKMNAVLKSGDRKVGKVIIGEVKKNKLAATEGLEIEGQLIFGEGFAASLDLIQEALDVGHLEKRGMKYFYGASTGKQHVATGMPKLRDWAKANEEMLKEALIKH